ncbi:uncharacterized protein LOC131168463 isoform X1 [Malania oleifera]|uniref:uncharacterized protein LOC131168463 isoform X1 n=1 Tax=Malania oleifera TaxID=397392 RepID=UPI0025AEC97B|nr:uncharacterized protein LOC131168463 isoform X1 [Malania oleifera]
MALDKAKGIVSSTPVVVFSKSFCPFCVEVKKLLSDMGASFKAIELDTESKQLPIFFINSCPNSCLIALTSLDFLELINADPILFICVWIGFDILKVTGVKYNRHCWSGPDRGRFRTCSSAAFTSAAVTVLSFLIPSPAR